MVSKIFTVDNLEQQTLAYASRIAKLPSMTSLMIKESVNETQDNQGFYNALSACFTLHQLNHAHWSEVTKGERAAARPEDGIPDWAQRPAGQAGREDDGGGGSLAAAAGRAWALRPGPLAGWSRRPRSPPSAAFPRCGRGSRPP